MTVSPELGTETTLLGLREIDLSLVIPMYEEEESIPELHRQVSDALDATHLQSEVVYVDDGSKDGTERRLEEVFQADPRVRVVSLRRNFGKTAALLAGFQESRGQVIVTLDGDLQDDPKELPRFLAQIDDGFDLVSGWKRVRHDPLTKTLPSRLFNATVRTFTGIPLHDFNCGFKAYRREVLADLKLYGELHRFIPVLAYWRGYRIGEIQVEHHARQFGRSKFGAGRLFRGLLDFMKVLFLTKYLQRPLQLFGPLGLALSALGLAGFAYLLFLKLLGQSLFQTHGPLLIVCATMLLGGIQLFGFGLLGEMLRHVTFRPSEEYSIKRRLARD